LLAAEGRNVSDMCPWWPTEDDTRPHATKSCKSGVLDEVHRSAAAHAGKRCVLLRHRGGGGPNSPLDSYRPCPGRRIEGHPSCDGFLPDTPRACRRSLEKRRTIFLPKGRCHRHRRAATRGLNASARRYGMVCNTRGQLSNSGSANRLIGTTILRGPHGRELSRRLFSLRREIEFGGRSRATTVLTKKLSATQDGHITGIKRPSRLVQARRTRNPY